MMPGLFPDCIEQIVHQLVMGRALTVRGKCPVPEYKEDHCCAWNKNIICCDSNDIGTSWHC